MAKDTFHVVPAGDGWAVKKEGAERPISTHDTQKSAIDSAREAATEGDELIIHRADGSIREHTTYAGTSSNGSTHAPRRSDRPEAQDIWSTGTRVRWGPILAGTVAAVAIALLLTNLAGAIGLTAADNMSARAASIVGGITLAIIMITAMFAGGYIATQTTTRETKFEAVLIGVLVWGATLAAVATGLVAGGNTALNATRTVNTLSSRDRPFWEQMNWNEDQFRSRLGTMSEEEQRAFNDYRDTRELSRRDAQRAAWWAFAGMALSMSACIAGALVGAGPDVTRRLLHHETTGDATPVLRRDAMTV